jgi:RimJ/RimL family protein N-acetyltransferase
VYLRTDRLLLRRFTEDDVENLVSLDADPEVMRLLTGGKPTPREVVEHELLPALLQDYDRFASLGRWAALDSATGEFIGSFSLTPREGGSGDEVELGYRLRRSACGKCYATEGSRALVDKAFAKLGVQRIYAETMAVNTASRRVLEKAGLRHVRTFHLHWDDPIEGTEHGEVEYELRRSHWKAERSWYSRIRRCRVSVL